MSKLTFSVDRVAAHLDAIKLLFKPGAKLTIFVRTPENEEHDVLLTDDDLDEVDAMLQRSKAREEWRP